MEPNRILRTISDVSPENTVESFDGLMIVSGNMADTEYYWKHERVLAYVETFNNQNKPIAAICCSVPTIRNAAKGKRVSFFPLVRSKTLLVSCGALPQTVTISRDDNLVTAEHQMASEVWANEFCNLIEGIPQQAIFHDSGFVPKGRERKPNKEVARLLGLATKHDSDV
jgi:putative intracellular protease/amidase